VLNGELSIHFPIRKSPRPSPDAPLRASLEVDQLDLATLLGNASPLTGKIHGNLNISGTIDHPVIQGKISSSKLALSGVLAPLNPLSIEIQAHPTPGMVALSAKVSSSLNAPIELTYNGTIRPLLFQDPLATNTTPDTLNLNLKGGSLQLLNQLNDTFKSVAGSVDISLSAKRANQTWQWSGKSSIKAQKLLFESPRAPGLTDLTLNATIKDSNTTAIELVTSSGGGTIRVHGDVQAPLSKNPTLNLSIQTRNVLAYRNESLLLRADSDLTFKGPWNDAVISGEAVPVQSKYFHDIEILPINLTKKGETRDRLKGLSPGFSFKQAPCSDWKFNIHFKSRPRDPMLIRGNRWQGEADVDMLWGGTGLRPWFEGYYHSKNLTAFLPSVRLTVSDGYLWYKRDSPFQGTLDVNALTTARGYRIAAYISGPLAQPDLLLTSKPALDQTDLLSLLTTGVLPSDTNDSPQVIAARATEAIAEDLSRSLLGVDRRMIEGIGRVDVEFSRVNPRTGQQETRVTRRLSEDWSVSGDIGTNGDFTGRLKFLHRFK
jgi:autotransporter translocation and assembly factor TamB